MDIFSWSLPFVAEKSLFNKFKFWFLVNEILVNVLKPSENDECDDEEMPSSFKEEEKKIHSEKSFKKSVMPVESNITNFILIYIQNKTD